jgi:hypothetical protein
MVLIIDETGCLLLLIIELLLQMLARRARWWLRMNIRCELLAVVYLWASFQHHGGDLSLLFAKRSMSQKSGHIRTPSGHTYGTGTTIDG